MFKILKFEQLEKINNNLFNNMIELKNLIKSVSKMPTFYGYSDLNSIGYNLNYLKIMLKLIKNKTELKTVWNFNQIKFNKLLKCSYNTFNTRRSKIEIPEHLLFAFVVLCWYRMKTSGCFWFLINIEGKLFVCDSWEIYSQTVKNKVPKVFDLSFEAINEINEINNLIFIPPNLN